MNGERFNLQDSPELTVAITNPYPNPSGLINVYNEAIERQFGVRYDERFLPPPGNRYTSYSSFCRPLLEGTVQQPPYQPVPSGICYPNAREQDSLIYSGKVDYSFTDKLHLTGILSYSDFGDDFVQNGDQSPLGYVLSKFSQHAIQRTAEVRLNGTSFGDRLDWVLGGFRVNYSGESNGFIGYITDNFNEFDRAFNEPAGHYHDCDHGTADAQHAGRRSAFVRDRPQERVSRSPHSSEPRRVLLGLSLTLDDGSRRAVSWRAAGRHMAGECRDLREPVSDESGVGPVVHHGRQAGDAEAPGPQYIIKPYAIANAQLDYIPNQGKWTATAGVTNLTNLTNKFYYYQLFSGGAINISSNVAPPREYFFSVRRDF